MCIYDKATPSDDDRAEENRINKALMPDAGKVPLDESMGCGRGICAEIKECLFKWWLPVRRHIAWSDDDNAQECSNLITRSY